MGGDTRKGIGGRMMYGSKNGTWILSQGSAASTLNACYLERVGEDGQTKVQECDFNIVADIILER